MFEIDDQVIIDIVNSLMKFFGFRGFLIDVIFRGERPENSIMITNFFSCGYISESSDSGGQYWKITFPEKRLSQEELSVLVGINTEKEIGVLMTTQRAKFYYLDIQSQINSVKNPVLRSIIHLVYKGGIYFFVKGFLHNSAFVTLINILFPDYATEPSDSGFLMFYKPSVSDKVSNILDFIALSEFNKNLFKETFKNCVSDNLEEVRKVIRLCYINNPFIDRVLGLLA